MKLYGDFFSTLFQIPSVSRHSTAKHSISYSYIVTNSGNEKHEVSILSFGSTQEEYFKLLISGKQIDRKEALKLSKETIEFRILVMNVRNIMADMGLGKKEM